MKQCFSILAILLLLIPAATHAGTRPDRIKVKVQRYDPYGGAKDSVSLVCFRLMQEDPTLDIEPYTWMSIEGPAGGMASYYMSHAAQIAPDVSTWVPSALIRPLTRQGFYYPLNEFIGEDKDGDGYISNDEAIWPEWKNMPEFARRMATIDGKVYGLPFTNIEMVSLLYRKDILRKSGIDPDKPPKDWEELYAILQKLTHPEMKIPGATIQHGQYGYALETPAFVFWSWLWAAGGDILVQDKINPRTGKTTSFAQEEMKFLDPETGEDLSKIPGTWRATFGSPAGIDAMGFYRRLRWAKWTRDPQTQEPVNLTDAQAAQGWKMLPDGRKISFDQKNIIDGVSRVLWGSDTANKDELFRRGEIGIILWVCKPDYFRALDIPSENLGIWPVPPMKAGGKPAMLAQYHYMSLNRELAGEKNREKRLKAWEVLSTLVGSKGAKWETELLVKQGMAKFMQPTVLARAGLNEYLDGIPEHWRKNWDTYLKYARSEPFEGEWQPIAGQVLPNTVFSLALTQKDFDWQAALKKAEATANNGLAFKRSEVVMQKWRPMGWVMVSLIGVFMCFMFYMIVKSLSKKPAQGDVLHRTGPFKVAWAPVILLAPALLSIAVWAYYPLIRGGVMAFQDYRVTGQSNWVGVDNFINVMLNPDFWTYLKKTFKFVVISIGLGFTAPLALALLMAEVPKGKMLFRTLFFLPQVSSGLVILFLWKILYNPTPSGYLNKLLALFHINPIDWLGNPTWTMAAVVLPGVWAGAGMGSLIYQAALKGIPEDLYEAAEVDGATMWRKFTHITIPSLLPLLIINFVGSFIGTFSSMGNIFAMTAGGPGNETMVMSLAIWYEAFAFLRFGTATAMAWIMGSILIGFTLMQLRILRRVEFRRAED